MTIFFTAMRLPLLLAIAICATVASASVGTVALALPTIAADQPFGPLAVVAVLPLAAPLALGWAADRAVPAMTAGAVRRREAHVVLVAALLAVVSGLASASVLAIGFTPLPLTALRNTLLYLALFLAAASFTGYRYAPMIPVAYVFLSGVFGRAGGIVQPWALPLLVDGSVPLLVFALALTATFSAGLVLVGARRSR